MTLYVLDASVAASWYVPQQATSGTDALLAVARDHLWCAPYCFAFETPNVLLGQERRGALPRRASELAMAELYDQIALELEPPPPPELQSEALILARSHGISLFEGFYLHLSLLIGASLATRDKALADAAQTEGCACAYVGPS